MPSRTRGAGKASGKPGTINESLARIQLQDSAQLDDTLLAGGQVGREMSGESVAHLEFGGHNERLTGRARLRMMAPFQLRFLRVLGIMRAIEIR